jgi:hypothetical protein
MTRKAIIVYTFSIVCRLGLAQDNNFCACEDSIRTLFEPKLTGEVYQPVIMRGMEFYHINYGDGTIILESGDTIFHYQIRYNGRLDALLYLVPNTVHEIQLDKFAIKEFYFNEDQNRQREFFRKIQVKNDFFSDSVEVFSQLLYEDRLSLFAFRQYVSIHDQLVAVTNDREIAKPLYVPSFIYYFQLPNHKTVGFKKFKRKDLYELFPERKEAMKQLFRENHQRRFKKESDLVRITEILNKMID